MEYVINISDWTGLDELQKYQIEVDSYSSLLIYLIHKECKMDSQYYQYYENKYLESYFKLFDKKTEFTSYLREKYKIHPSNNWNIDFIKKEVIINDE